MDNLTERLDHLDEVNDAHAAAFEAIVEFIDETNKQLENLSQRIDIIADVVSDLDGAKRRADGLRARRVNLQ